MSLPTSTSIHTSPLSPERLRVLFCDHLNLARGKYISDKINAKGKAQDGSARYCRGTFGVTFEKELIPTSGSMVLEGLPDMEAAYDSADIRPSWLSANALAEKVVVGDLKANDGSPLPMCGRSALKKAIADWNALGYEPMVGVELEAYAFQIESDGSLVPYATPAAHVYGTGPFSDPRGVMDAIWERATASGFRIDSMNTEYDSPQFELTLTFDHALKAIDDIFLFRLLAREVAIQKGIVLTFLPKPLAVQGGSGVHINFSLRDKNGKNAVNGGHDINALTKACTAGLMQHHQALAGIAAPSVNSYARLQPASLSGYWQNWGVDHRGVTVRLSAEDGAAARIEHRMGDGAANPYTLTAAVLQAARLGVVNQYPLQAPETGNCLDSHDATQGVASSLGAALDALAADTALVAALGEGLVANHIDIKRHEVERTKDLTHEQIRDYYIRYI